MLLPIGLGCLLLEIVGDGQSTLQVCDSCGVEGKGKKYDDLHEGRTVQ